MTQKDFTTYLQKSCHLDRQQCAVLLNAVGKLMAQAGVEQIPVTLPGLGTFVSHKHPEYIANDPETGQQTLYPPRITYRMQVEEEGVGREWLDRQLAESTKTPEKANAHQKKRRKQEKMGENSTILPRDVVQ